MPQISAETWVPVVPEVAFAVSQTTGALRLRWDPFIRHQRFLDGATKAGKGVRTLTRARVGPRMVSEYVSYRPPTSVGMTMVTGPWFFRTFGGGWRFTASERGGTPGTVAVWKYTYAVQPGWLSFVAHPVGQWLLGREIRIRIAAFARACEDPDIVAGAAQT
ncbi:hypothetical protein GCM10023169_10180 [Georgenia halophila]|uniref:SRPBCC family protein n=1 Tax=Georgenia halophila TaxID=620889 RepID=A0ABP8KYZ2_9MICO